MNDVPQQHESYGLLQISKESVAGQTGNLFACTTEQSHAITLKITRAELDQREGAMMVSPLNHGKDVIAEMKLSPAQFAQVLACQEIGNGVPVTLVKVRGQQLENCPFQNAQSKFQREFQKQTEQIITGLHKNATEVQDLMVQKKTLNKTEKEFIGEVLMDSLSAISQFLPQLETLFLKEMEQVTLAQKLEVVSFSENIHEQQQEMTEELAVSTDPTMTM